MNRPVVVNIVILCGVLYLLAMLIAYGAMLSRKTKAQTPKDKWLNNLTYLMVALQCIAIIVALAVTASYIRAHPYVEVPVPQKSRANKAPEKTQTPKHSRILLT